jgi:hypothetical protein
MGTIINFACSNCLTIFDVEMEDIHFDKVRELHFTPEPECTFCGGIDDVVLSDYGLEQIDDLIFSNKIRTVK